MENEQLKSKFDTWLSRIMQLLAILPLVGVTSFSALFQLNKKFHQFLLLNLSYNKYISISTIVCLLLTILLTFLFYQNKKLKKKLKIYTDWKKVKEQYELIKIDDGVHVYSNKKQPELLFCPNCLDINKKESKLNSEPTSEFKVSIKYCCCNCKNSFKVTSKTQPNNQSKITRTGPWG